MPRVSFLKGRGSLEVPSGSNLMNALQAAGIPVASSCRGEGVCVKCRLHIVSGAEHLSRETDLEVDLRERYEIPQRERISCQTLVFGDITIDASYW